MTIQDAFDLIEAKNEELPFEAIDFIYNQPLNSIIEEKILFYLKNAYNDEVAHDKDNDFYYPTPLWYAIIAEKYISTETVKATISLFTSTIDGDWDYLNEQGQYLVGLYCEKLGDEAVSIYFDTIENLIKEGSEMPYLFLFDCLYYADVNKYQERLEKLAEYSESKWYEVFSHSLAFLKIKKAIPIFKKILKIKKDDYWYEVYFNREIKEALTELESGVNKYPEISVPFYNKRNKDWKIVYENYNTFEERDDDDDDDFFDTESPKRSNYMPYIAPIKIGRNDPCPCGSGKKYKKCCINK